MSQPRERTRLRRVAPAPIALVVACLAVAPAAASELPAPFVDAYLAAQASLAGDSTQGLAAHARAMAAAAAPLGEKAAALAAAARTLEAAADITGARVAFGELNDALNAYMDATGTTLGAGLRLAFCPMASKTWLQKEKEIRNPYYGSSMLTCGTFRK
ncbi:MAG: hypothetical protein AB1635_09345 [Acidobacteriota bacterium]